MRRPRQPLPKLPRYDRGITKLLSLLAALAMSLGLQGVVRADHLNNPQGDWFLVIVTAGPEGATDYDATWRVSGRTTGAPMVHGIAFSDGEWAGGAVSADLTGGVRVGVSGAADFSMDVVPRWGPGTFQSGHRLFGDRIEPGKSVYALSFTSGTIGRIDSLVATANGGSVSTEIHVGSGSAAIMLLENKDGLAAEFGVGAAAVATSYEIDSPGLVGGFSTCFTCLGEWTSPDGRSGVNQTGGADFSGPAGRWRLSWNGLTHPGSGWATVGGYAPIGNHWKHFPFSPNLA